MGRVAHVTPTGVKWIEAHIGSFGVKIISWFIHQMLQLLQKKAGKIHVWRTTLSFPNVVRHFVDNINQIFKNEIKSVFKHV